ncbi:VCBS repeat-containing protein [Streptomyces sp. NPDC002133]|uniref:FG-GAP repeat domain-containing protein n=1 Tax=Streptomyces sp. NPDC002133 TaxID=3154409 RepID=UPI003323A289
MPHARSTRRFLVAAVTTILAVTMGAGALSVPASAATTAGTMNAAADAITLPKDSKLIDAGLTGFLSRPGSASETRWTRYADGSSQTYGLKTALRSSRTTDFLVFPGLYSVTLRDLRTFSSLEVPVGTSAGGAVYVGSAADALFTTVASAEGVTLRKHTKAGGTVTVTGLPAGATAVAVAPGTPEDALVTFTDGTVKKWGLLDLATGAVDEIRDRPAGSVNGDVAVSETHVTWTEGIATSRPAVFLLDRATGTVEEVPVEDVWASDLQVGLVGGWVVYGEAGGLSSGDTNPLYVLTAYDPATKTKVKLLDHLTSSAAAPDGLYVRGGTVAQGEGLYKIAPGANGTPAVALVAGTGEPTEVVITGNNVPATVDLDTNGGKTTFTWGLSRNTVDVKVTLRHVRTGKTREFSETHPYNPSVSFTWHGDLGPDTESAYNGDYTWEMTARPLNGIGPTATASGTFKAVRKTAPHDFDDNGAPDALFRDGSGRLWRSDTTYFEDNGQLRAHPRQLIGAGWQIYDRIEATGNVGGSAFGDVLARDKAGVLWLYQGTGRGGFATRVKVGAGWQIYDKIAGGSDLTGDGRSDLVASDTSGGLWLYKSTGSATAPFSARKKIGTGWGIYNDLAAVGNLAGGPAGDLLARDKAGVLWLYLGNGDGTFAPRTKVGGGWNAYTHLVGVGDANRDGRPDLVGFGPKSEYLYRGTGDWRTPLRGAQPAGLTLANGPYNHVA